MTYTVLIALISLLALGRAFWKGARPQVVLFGADFTAALLNRARRKLGIPERMS